MPWASWASTPSWKPMMSRSSTPWAVIGSACTEKAARDAIIASAAKSLFIMPPTSGVRAAGDRPIGALESRVYYSKPNSPYGELTFQIKSLARGLSLAPGRDGRECLGR